MIERNLSQLTDAGVLSEDAAAFLAGAVAARLNIMVSGRTGTGKTTLLNALAGAVAGDGERVLLVEEAEELGSLRIAEGVSENWVHREVRHGEPGRLVIGEVRGGDRGLLLLAAMARGFGGSMCTIHADSARGALTQLHDLVSPSVACALRSTPLPGESLLALGELSELATASREELSGAVTEVIAETVQLVVQVGCERASGERYVDSIFELTGCDHADGVHELTGVELWARHDDSLAFQGVPSRHLQN